MINHLSFADRYDPRRRFGRPVGLLGLALLLSLAAAGCASLSLTPLQDLKGQADQAYEAGDYAAAADQYRRYLDRRSDDASAWFRFGYAEAQTGRLVAAEHALRKALALDPNMARARHNLGMVQIQLGVKAILSARRNLPDVDQTAARTMQYLACLMETFMGFPDPKTCSPADVPVEYRHGDQGKAAPANSQ